MSNEHKEIAKKITTAPAWLRSFFFLCGIVATIAYRITFLLDPIWTKIVWYIGTIGFAIYFGHRMGIETKRAKLVEDYKLVSTIGSSDIPAEKKNALSYLIKTSLTSKARFNSAFIFWASILALLISIALDANHYF